MVAEEDSVIVVAEVALEAVPVEVVSLASEVVPRSLS